MYYAFDLLQLEEVDLTREPPSKRREALSQVVAGSRVLLSEPSSGLICKIFRDGFLCPIQVRDHAVVLCSDCF